MKNRISTVVAVALCAAFSAGAFAQDNAAAQTREKAMKDCFEKHKGLMDKPAIRNPRDCWRVHGGP